MKMQRTLRLTLATLCLLHLGLWSSAHSEESIFVGNEHGEECRLKVLVVGGILNLGAINYAVGSGRLYFPSHLSEVDKVLEGLPYKVSTDREDFFLTCHRPGAKGVSGYPYFTASKLGLSDVPLEPQVPFKEFRGLSVAEFLGISAFPGHYRIVNMGRLRVLAIKPDPGKPEIVVEILNPDPDLKRLQANYLQGNAYDLTKVELKEIIEAGEVTDPWVCNLLKDHCRE